MRDGETEREKFEREEAEETALINKISNVEVSDGILKVKFDGEDKIRELEILDGNLRDREILGEKIVVLNDREYSLVFDKEDFRKKLKKLNKETKPDINFSRHIFLNDLVLNSGTFLGELDLGNDLSRKDILFYKSIFQGKIDIRGLAFEKPINFNSSSCIGKVDFHHVRFAKDLFFSFTTFRDDVNFGNNDFARSVNLAESIFLNKVSLTNLTIDGQLDFSGATFMKKLFSSSKIDSLNFSYIKFNKEKFDVEFRASQKLMK